MVVTHLITHGLFFAVIFNGYLLLVMALTSPRVWGYTDYPEVVKHKVPLMIAFLNSLALFLLATVGDLVILDWLIVSKITPKFVIIPGSERADYKDFSHHYKAHAKALAGLILVCLIIAGIVCYF